MLRQIIGSAIVIMTLLGCNNKNRPEMHAEVSKDGKPVLYIHPVQEAAAYRIELFMMTDGKRANAPIITENDLSNDTLYIQPKFKVDAGAKVTYIVYEGADSTMFELNLPIDESQKKPCALAIYPKEDTVPINTLMFHVKFSQPMNEDILAYKYVKLLDETGEEKQMVWREHSGWTSNGEHLVLMIHPGWVKREIHYLDKYGPNFEIGRKYKIVLGAELKGRNGLTLCKEFSKDFIVGKEDRTSPILLSKELPNLSAGSQDTLMLSFNEKIDYGSAMISLYVRNEKGEKVIGRWFTRDELHWHFVPDDTWEKQQYTLEITEELSDVASNHLHRLFEETDAEKMRSVPPVILSFSAN